MDEQSVKAKNTESRRLKFPIGFLALLLAVGLCLIFREIVFSTLGFPMPCWGAISYPLLLLTLYPPLQIALWGSVILLFTVLLALALSRRVNMIFVLVACLVGVGLLLNTWTGKGPLRSLVTSDTYAEGDSLYRLLYVSGEGVGVEDVRYPIRTFVLLKCDALGWGWCEMIGTADMTVGRMGSPTEVEIASARLYRDVTHDSLTVQMHDSMGLENERTFIGCMLF